MSDTQVAFDLTTVAAALFTVVVAVVTAVGGFITARITAKSNQDAQEETTAGSILDTVWTKFGALEQRVVVLEGKVNRRDILLALSRGQIIEYEERWPEAHQADKPRWHPELRPFLSTGLIDQTEQAGAVSIEVKPSNN